MKKLIVLFLVVFAMACGKSQTQVVTPAKPASEASPWVQASGKTGWSLEVPKDWAAYPSEKEGAWRNKAKSNAITIDSTPYVGDPNILFDEVISGHEEAGVKILRVSKITLAGKPAMAAALAGGGIFVVQFVVVSDKRAYALSCATLPDAIEGMKSACEHATKTLTLK